MASTARKVIIMILVLVCMSYASSQGMAEAGDAGLRPEVVVYSQPPDPIGTLFPSSFLNPGYSPDDRYVYDGFTLALPNILTEVDWIGGYDPSASGSGGPVLDFTVAFYPSNISGQPDISNPPMASFQVGGNAGETVYGVLNGVTMYSYSFVLPAPFAALSGARYWVQIYAWQGADPDWGLAKGTNGDNFHFLKIPQGGSFTYHIVQGDVAFSLRGSASNPVWLPFITR